MTREESIKWLYQIKERYISGGDESFDKSRKEAIDMAIRALSEESTLCPMRNEIGNCLPAGGFCGANKNICHALHNAYNMGMRDANMRK